jgi:hypothetical protein
LIAQWVGVDQGAPKPSRLGVTRNRLVAGLLVVKDLAEIAHVNALATGGALIEMLEFAFRLSVDSDSFNQNSGNLKVARDGIEPPTRGPTVKYKE